MSTVQHSAFLFAWFLQPVSIAHGANFPAGYSGSCNNFCTEALVVLNLTAVFCDFSGQSAGVASYAVTTM